MFNFEKSRAYKDFLASTGRISSQYSRRVPSKTSKALASVSTVPLNSIQKRQVKRIAQADVELKQYAAGGFNQTFASGVNISVIPLITPPQDNKDSGRVGDQLSLKSLRMKMLFTAAIGSGVVLSQLARVVIFQLIAPGNTAPNMTNMFLQGAGAGAVNAYSATNIDYADLYHVLFDRTFPLIGQDNGVATTNTLLTTKYNQFLDFSVPLKYAKKHIQFTAGSTNSNNQIYMAVIGGTPSASVNPQYNYDYSVRFTDQ